MPEDHKPAELACILTADEHAARIAWIEQLNATALCGYHRDGHRMQLRYHPSAAAKAREFIRREQQCCPFLRFTTEETGGAFLVAIDAPPGLDSAPDALFAPYTRGQKR